MYNVKDESFKQTDIYKNFINIHPSFGRLKIKASAASGAVPISGLKIVVTTNIDNYNVIFYEGYTDSSGVISGIMLPAYKLDSDNLNVPLKTVYNVEATYLPENLSMSFKVNIYENVSVVQNINIIPEMRIIEGDILVS